MAGLEMKYFVLKPKSKHHDDIYAKASRAALTAYAEVIQLDNDQLAEELLNWVNLEETLALSVD